MAAVGGGDGGDGGGGFGTGGSHDGSGDNTTVSVVKWADFSQNSSMAPVAGPIPGDANADRNNYFFQSVIQGANLSNASSAPTVTLPNNTTYALELIANGTVWGFDGSQSLPVPNNFAGPAALDAAFPNGNYLLSIGGANFPTSLLASPFPDAPTITGGQWDSSGNLIVNAGSAYALNFNPFTGYASAGTIQLNIFAVTFDGGGNPELGASVFSASLEAENGHALPPAMTITAGTLLAGDAYYAELSFANITNAVNGSLPPALLNQGRVESRTGFYISAIPEPGMLYYGLGLAGLFGSIWRWRRRTGR